MVGGKLFNSATVFLILTVLGSLIIYIIQIRSKLSTLLAENANLLDGMHEGLVVLNTEDSKPGAY